MMYGHHIIFLFVLQATTNIIEATTHCGNASRFRFLRWQGQRRTADACLINRKTKTNAKHINVNHFASC